jgi:hypothetical protein
MRRTMLLVLALAMADALAAGKPAASAPAAVDKTALSYRGIVPGQSHKDDVLKAFGTPRSSGTNSGDDGKEVDLLEFHLDDAVFESADVELEQDSGVVHSILLWPKGSYPTRDLFKTYGRHYVVRDPYKARCSNQKFTPAKDYDPGLDEPQDSDALYVYAQGRLEAFVVGGGQVESLEFRRRCPERSVKR